MTSLSVGCHKRQRGKSQMTLPDTYDDRGLRQRYAPLLVVGFMAGKSYFPGNCPADSEENSPRSALSLGAGSQRPTDARCTQEAGLNNQAVKWGNNEDVGPT